jgi:hypothetical protein
VFADFEDLNAYVDDVMEACSTIVALQVEQIIDSFCTSNDAPNIPKPDLTEASELIAFMDVKNTEHIIAVISSLGEF